MNIYRLLLTAFFITVIATIGYTTHLYTSNLKGISELVPVISLNSETLWNEIQEWRSDNNLQPYIENENLCFIAENRTTEIESRFTHSTFENNFSEYPSVLQENIAKSNLSEHSLLLGWLNSPSHRIVLESKYIYSCARINNGNAVQIFSNCENGCPKN